MSFLSDKIYEYAEKHTTPDSPALQALIRETHLNTLAPRMLSGHLQGRLLSLLSHLVQPRKILEIGTFTGYSALCLAEGLADGGIVYALEANDELEYMIRKYITETGFDDTIKLLIGNALDIIPTIDEIFDLVFIDAGKKDYPVYYDLVIDKVRSGGLIIADNILWSGKVVADKKDVDTQIIDGFNKKIHHDDRVENLLLPIRDGLMIIRKK